MLDQSNSLILHTLKQQVIDTRQAYYAGMKGVEYADMAASARRYLTMRNLVETAAGHSARPVTKVEIARLLRGER